MNRIKDIGTTIPFDMETPYILRGLPDIPFYEALDDFDPWMTLDEWVKHRGSNIGIGGIILIDGRITLNL